MRTKHTIWEISFYISLLIILIWLILKLIGIINTPAFLEYGVPILSAMYALFALYRDLLDRINRISNGLTKVFIAVEHLETKVGYVENELNLLKTKGK